MDDAKTANETKAGADGDAPEGLGYEEALGRLGRAVEALEAGDLGLDDALARYEDGVRLLVRCRTLLDGAEKKVALLTGLDDQGRPITEPFDAQATADRAAPTAPTVPGTTVSPDDPEDEVEIEDEDEDDAPF